MKTSARIFVELKESDKNVPLEFFHLDFPDQFPLNELDRREFDVNLVDGIDKEEKIFAGRYLSITNQYNGSPEQLGKCLVRDFNSYDEALNLVLGGNVMCIDDNEDVELALMPYYYMLNIGHNKWSENAPIQSDDFLADCEFAYLFKDGSWHIVSKYGDKTYLNDIPFLIEEIA